MRIGSARAISGNTLGESRSRVHGRGATAGRVSSSGTFQPTPSSTNAPTSKVFYQAVTLPLVEEFSGLKLGRATCGQSVTLQPGLSWAP